MDAIFRYMVRFTDKDGNITYPALPCATLEAAQIVAQTTENWGDNAEIVPYPGT